jgi:hypothetical protein
VVIKKGRKGKKGGKGKGRKGGWKMLFLSSFVPFVPFLPFLHPSSPIPCPRRHGYSKFKVKSAGFSFKVTYIGMPIQFAGEPEQSIK